MVDIQDVPRDQALLWLHVAVDAEAMRQRLQPHFGDGVQLVQVKVGRFTYKPGRNARFAYRIKLLDRKRGVAAKHVVHGRMEPPEESAHTYRKMQRQAWAQPEYGPALVHFEDLGIVLWGFPNDPKLPGIDQVAQPAAMLESARRIPALAALEPTACESSIVKYVPGKRLVMKHRLTRGDGKRLLLYTKTYAHARGASIHAVMRALWERAAGDPEALTCPEPLAWLPEANTLVLRALPGTAAIGALDPATIEHDMAQAGRGLARLHTSGVTGLEPWSSADELQNLEKAAGSLERYDPDLGPVLSRVLSGARAELGALTTGPAVPIHGAFRFTQLLTYRDRLALVDFDGFKQGHPMCDVGSFAAHLWYLHAKHELDADTAQAAVRAFTAGYRSVAPWGTPEPALRGYTAVQLVAKHVQKCVKRLKDDGDSKIQQMLQLAERLLDGDLPVA